MALGVGLYLIPLGMIANPDLITLGSNPILSLMAMSKVGFGLTLISFGIISPRLLLFRIMLCLLGGIILFI